MDLKLLTTSAETATYVVDVQTLADSQRAELGFLPASVYEEQSDKDRLWVAIDAETGYLAGYLLFGGRYPHLKIFQLYVVPEFRGNGVGKFIIQNLVNFADDNNYQIVTAKVAADIKANIFWDACGFTIIRQIQGGKVKNRVINVRAIELTRNSLFCLHKSTEAKGNLLNFNYPSLPALPNPTYVIDINVLFDLLKNRGNKDYVQHIFSLALINDISIAVTSEFSKELERNSHNFNKDPILEFARSLPTLPEVNDLDLKSMMRNLRAIVFPGIPKTGKHVVNDTSDLRHLASCIHHKIGGFLTGEKAILRCSAELKNIFNIEVLSVSDLWESTLSLNDNGFDINAEYGDYNISITELEERDRESIEKFLEKMGLESGNSTKVLHPGVQTSKRNRYVVIVNEDVVGVATWDKSTNHKPHCTAYLLVDESSGVYKKISDHLLEKIHRMCPYDQITKVHLMLARHQIHTIETAKYRGYRASENDNVDYYELVKICYNGVITKNNWNEFRKSFNALTEMVLPKHIPTYAEAKNTGFHLHMKSGDSRSCTISLYDFETLISPGILKLDGRRAVHVPIRETFAASLLHSERRQGSLLPQGENLLHIEKAYFMKANSHKKFEVGGIVIFYVSGANHGRMESVGMARVTYADTLNIETAKLSFSRQGVLQTSELESISDEKGMIAVITFDNFMAFKNPLAYKTLRDLGCISGANLVTSEILSQEKFTTILENAFK